MQEDAVAFGQAAQAHGRQQVSSHGVVQRGVTGRHQLLSLPGGCRAHRPGTGTRAGVGPGMVAETPAFKKAALSPCGVC